MTPMATWSDVRRIALALPGTSEARTARGWRVWSVNKKFVVWERPLLASDLAALGRMRAVSAFLTQRRT